MVRWFGRGRGVRAGVFAAWALLAVVGHALAGGEPPRPETVLTPEVPSEPQPVRRDGESTLRFALRFAPGWHAYAPGAHDFLPLEVKPGTHPALEVLGVSISPEPQIEHVLGQQVGVWGGRLEVAVRLRPRPGTAVGTRGGLPLEIGYQACDDSFVNCLFPHTHRVALPFEVVAGGEAAASDTPRAVSVPASAGEPEAPAASSAAPASATARVQGAGHGGGDDTSPSFLLEMVLALLAGLGVTLTPCVYPIIPVTVSYFQRQGGSKRAAVPLALAYGLGIVVMYTALGLVMARLGRDLGAVLGNPWVMWGFVALFVALAMSMFGYFELALPASLTTRLQASGQRGGLLGALILGLTLGLVAAPCVGPVAGGLMLVVATRGDLLFGLATFGAFGVGLATPFVLLGIFSSRLSALPRAGGWMETVKHVFGWILLAFAIYFANVALGDEQVLLALTGLYVYFAGLSAYRGGRARLEAAAHGSPFGAALWGGGLLVALFGGYLLLGPVLLPEEGGLLRRPEALFASEIDWHTGDHDALLAEARRLGKPVVIDFTARWCIPCQQMELTTFRDPRVIAAMKRFYPIRIDITSDEAAQQLKIERYRSYTVPFIAFWSSDGRYLEDKAIAGKTTTEAFLQRLKEIP